MPDVVLVPTSSARHGLGHLKRCEVLAEWINALGLTSRVLPLDVDVSDELGHTLPLLKKELSTAPIWVIDASVPGCERLARNLVTLLESLEDTPHITVIEDPHLQQMSTHLPDRFVSTVLVPHGLPLRKSCAREHRGIGFAVVSRELLSRPKQRPVSSQLRLLVTAGGLDPKRITEFYLRAIDRVAIPALSIDVVIGPHFAQPYRDTLSVLAAESRHSVTLLTGLSSLTHEISSCDLALCGGGLTKLELAVSGIPTLVVDDTEAHSLDSKALSAMGAAVALGVIDDLNLGNVAEVLDDLISDPVRQLSLRSAGRNLLSQESIEETVRVICGLE